MLYTLTRRRVLTQMGYLGLGLGLAGLSSCGNVSPPKPPEGEPEVPNIGLQSPGLLRWGADGVDGAPYVFLDPDDPSKQVGFEAEIAVALGQLMGVEQVQIQTDYAQLAAALLAGQFDLILNGWEANPDRAATELFTVPYYRNTQQVVVRTDDPRFQAWTTETPITLANLAGMTVGTGLGFKSEDILTADKNLTTKSYDGNLPFDDLRLKRLDAVMLDYPMAAYYVLGAGVAASPDPSLKLVGQPLYPGDYVMGISRENPKAELLQAEVNQAITQLKKDGQLKKIYDRWGLWNQDQKEIGIMG